MGKVVTFFEPGKVGVTEVEDAPLKHNEVRLETQYSGFSAGTELTHYRGSNIYLHKHWDPTDRLFLSNSETTSKTYPIIGTGYEECGKITEIGNEVTKVKIGDLIYGTWQHRTQHVVDEDYAVDRILPENLDPILGIFSQMTAISYNGILDAAIRLGETVAIFGMGVPGQICAQMVKRSGAKVIGILLGILDIGPAVDQSCDNTGSQHRSQDTSPGDALGQVLRWHGVYVDYGKVSAGRFRLCYFGDQADVGHILAGIEGLRGGKWRGQHGYLETKIAYQFRP